MLIIILAIIGVGFGASTEAISQSITKKKADESEKTSVIFNLSYNSLNSNFDDISGLASLIIIPEDNVFLEGRVAQLALIEGGASLNEDKVFDFGILMGYIHNFNKHFYISGAVGVGLTSTSSRRGDYRNSINITGLNEGFGIPVDFQLILHNSFIGAGLSVYGNINSELTMFGLALSLQVGDY